MKIPYELEFDATTLYEKGWKCQDREELINNLNYSEEEAEIICMLLEVLEKEDPFIY